LGFALLVFAIVSGCLKPAEGFVSVVISLFILLGAPAGFLHILPEKIIGRHGKGHQTGSTTDEEGD
jgi:hypothetical protein